MSALGILIVILVVLLVIGFIVYMSKHCQTSQRTPKDLSASPLMRQTGIENTAIIFGREESVQHTFPTLEDITIDNGLVRYAIHKTSANNLLIQVYSKSYGGYRDYMSIPFYYYNIILGWGGRIYAFNKNMMWGTPNRVEWRFSNPHRMQFEYYHWDGTTIRSSAGFGTVHKTQLFEGAYDRVTYLDIHLPLDRKNPELYNYTSKGQYPDQFMIKKSIPLQTFYMEYYDKRSYIFDTSDYLIHQLDAGALYGLKYTSQGNLERSTANDRYDLGNLTQVKYTLKMTQSLSITLDFKLFPIPSGFLPDNMGPMDPEIRLGRSATANFKYQYAYIDDQETGGLVRFLPSKETVSVNADIFEDFNATGTSGYEFTHLYFYTQIPPQQDDGGPGTSPGTGIPGSGGQPVPAPAPGEPGSGGGQPLPGSGSWQGGEMEPIDPFQ